MRKKIISCILFTGIFVISSSLVYGEGNLSKELTAEKTVDELKRKNTNEKQYAATYLNVRAEASLESEIKDTLNTGDEVYVTDISKDKKWSYIEYGSNQNGYVDNEYLVGEDKIEKLPDGVILVKAEKDLYATIGVYVREDDTKDSKAIGVLDEGESIKATGICSNDWIRVKYENKDAYVYGEYLSTELPQQSNSQYEDETWEDTVYDNHSNQEDTSNLNNFNESHSNPESDDEELWEEWLGEHYGYDSNGMPINPAENNNDGEQHSNPESDDEELWEKYLGEHYGYNADGSAIDPYQTNEDGTWTYPEYH